LEEKEMAGKNYQAVIDDGTREIPIKNKFGKLICNIYIRPADISILERYNKLTDDFEEIVKPLQSVNINPDGTAKFEEEWAAIKAAENELKKRINAVFDMEEADEIFKTRNPFSSVNGKFFCENVLEVIGNIITESIEDAFEESEKRTEKYLKDLRKAQK
jgi:hypothetical protein